VQLTTVRAKRIVVLDEFILSGGTFIALQKLLSHFHQTAYGFVTLLDLSPLKREVVGAPCYALYEWQHREELEIVGGLDA